MTGLFMREKFQSIIGNNTGNSQHNYEVYLWIQIYVYSFDFSEGLSKCALRPRI
jgi:hypothetical protein